ncbi:COP9 signalosome complex subunit 8 [Leptopilina heterotoma]|uniref:COP9 signalosome complex subunit 8 n=1 Tax=Leptopilina heterotoma TaxID=63436 RepID=UPI001CA7EE07|nr:COP9 signalosome complex subunit 8 [Leptopilina heterotoma]
MVLSKINGVLRELERAELEAEDGVVSSQVYTRLLAIYLYQNELCYAKYLWKRIPDSVKSSSAELCHVWTVGQHMWKRDWPAVHAALNVNWSEDVDEVMNALKENVRERAMVLVSEAYSSLDVEILAGMTGLSGEQTQNLALERGWTVDGTMIQPRKLDREQSTPAQETLTEEQLYKLTQFVSFLEN